MNKGLFLDRDGVINIEQGYVHKPEQFDFQQGIFEIANWAKDNDYLLIVITNQGGIAYGYYSVSMLHKIHKKMLDGFENQGISLSGIYFCPHHNDISNCLCRKPKNLLFQKAVAEWDIDCKKSIMVGDRERDLIPAAGLGMSTIYLGEDKGIRCDKRCNSLREMLKYLVSYKT